MAQQPPPWQNELFRAQDQPRIGLSTVSVLPSTDHNESLSDAWRHVKQISKNVGKDHDLLDLLRNTKREETYQIQVAGWPSLLRKTTPLMSELPGMVQDKYRACQTMCFCGLMPEIRRAWASVDNSLFLWRYDRSNDVPVEYCGESQAISCVGLVRPRPGVFLEAIQYLLVVCTTIEIVLLGVCLGRKDELSLQPLPMYSLLSDNVLMTHVAATTTGRIFLAGADGNLYEIQYAAQDTWRQKRCTKVLVTRSLQQLLPGFIPTLVFGHPVPIERLAVDNDRHILYALLQNSGIQVFDLGANGMEGAKKVAEVHDFVGAASKAAPINQVFRAQEKKAVHVRSIAPISPSESTKLHLLAVTSDGRRVYFSVYPSQQLAAVGPVDPTKVRPHTLVAVIARQALPQGGGVAGRLTVAELSSSAKVEINAAHYSSGCLLVSQVAGPDGRITKVNLICRNLSLPPASVHTGFNIIPGYRETVAGLEEHVAGETCAIAAVPTPSVSSLKIGVQDELTQQLFTPAPRFVLITTAGVIELQKLRPAELLQILLEERTGDRLQQFFETYGAQEAAAMCWHLVTSSPADVGPRAIQGAALALETSTLVGEPHMPDEAPAARGGGLFPSSNNTLPVGGGGNGGGIFMGQAVSVNPEPTWSAAHSGLCLYLSRLLAPAWEQKLVVVASKDPEVLACQLSLELMKVLGAKLQMLDVALQGYLQRRENRGVVRGTWDQEDIMRLGGGLLTFEDTTNRPELHRRPPAALLGPPLRKPRVSNALVMEEQCNVAVRSLVRKTVEALALLQIFANNNINRLTTRLDPAIKRSLQNLTLRDLVYDPEGDRVAAALISNLVTQQLDARGGVDELAALLGKSCPAYFKEDDKIYYKAASKLKAAEQATSLAQRQALAKEAVVDLLRVPLSCDLKYTVSQLAQLKQYEGVVRLPLAAAQMRDPDKLCLQPELGARYQRACQLREQCYKPLLEELTTLVSPAPTTSSGAPQLTAAEREAYKTTLLKTAAASNDGYFRRLLYYKLVDLQDFSDLLSLQVDDLEDYLAKEGGLTQGVQKLATVERIGPLSGLQEVQLELLAKLYVNKKRFSDAAQVYRILGDRISGHQDLAVSLEKRIHHYQDAVLQARSAGDGHLSDSLKTTLQILTIQAHIAQRLRDQIEGGPPANLEGLQQALVEVDTQMKDISELYNTYASPHGMWDVCLELLDFADQQDVHLTCQLWDLYLKEAIDKRPGELAQDWLRVLEEVCQRVEMLGERFFPNTCSFPVVHVATRLEQLAAGQWPYGEQAEAGQWPGVFPLPGPKRVISALVKACKGDARAVQRVYDALLGRKVAGIGVSESELSRREFRVHLLRSLIVLCAHLAEEEVQGPLVGQMPLGTIPFMLGRSPSVGALAEACDRYTIECRKLGGLDDLGGEFQRIKHQVENYA